MSQHTATPAHGNLPHGFPPPGRLIPARPVKVRGSLFASLVLGLTFNASMVSVVGSKLGFFSSSIGNAIAASALVGLIIVNSGRSRKFTFSSLPADFKFAVIMLGVITFIIGVYGMGSPSVASDLKRTVFLKTMGVLVSIWAMAKASCYYNFKEISLGLLIFSFVELVGCVALYFVPSDVNENTIAVRATVACMCIFTLIPYRWVGWGAVIGCIAFSAMLGCRTSSVAFIGAIVLMYAEQRTRSQRGLIVFLSMTGIACAMIFIPLIFQILQQVAVANLDSENPLARFFLHDKSSSKISYDYLDRFEVWTYAWEFIREKPILGYGLGTEKEIMEVRCHNAYLSLMFEGGSILLFAWVWFYARAIKSFFNRCWLAAVGESSLFHLTTMLLAYMLMAGIVESSGLSSVSTPINLIFIFLICWLSQPNRDPYRRTFTGG